MRAFHLITVVALVGGLGGAAYAAPQLDSHGKCRDNGKFVAASHCKAPAAKAGGKCRDAKGKFVSCSAPGAKPAK